jgi:predicted flap endonuclease-1-like 5' DNA nuclease
MSLVVTELRSVTPALADALREAGLADSEKLLAAAATPDARAQLAARLGIDPRAVLELANRADLGRIRGIGVVYSDLLEFAGVDTVAELATRNPDNLCQKIVDIAAGHPVQRLPRPADIVDWVAQAKALPRALEY